MSDRPKVQQTPAALAGGPSPARALLLLHHLRTGSQLDFGCVNGAYLEPCADVKNRRGKSTSGRKVTGLAFQPPPPCTAAAAAAATLKQHTGPGGLLLVTSGDARLRLFDGYALVCKAKGPTLGCAFSAARHPNDALCWSFCSLCAFSMEFAEGVGVDTVFKRNCVPFMKFVLPVCFPRNRPPAASGPDRVHTHPRCNSN